MELSALNHIESGKLPDFKADLFITTLGFESRSTSIARLLESVSCRKIAFTDLGITKGIAYEKNREYFAEKGFEIIEVGGDYPEFDSLMTSMMVSDFRLICDCTNMPQKWYYELFRWFSDDQSVFTSAVMRLAYTMASYAPPGPPVKIRRLREFTGAADRNGMNRKKALILGLGHEQGISDSIFKLIKPDQLYLFYADPPAEKQYVEKLFVNNHALINTTPIRNLVAYPIRNGQQIYQILIDTILPLRNEYSIHLVPQGPKIFSVASMLVHFSYPDAIISYPEVKKSNPTDRQSYDEPVVMDVHFEVDE